MSLVWLDLSKARVIHFFLKFVLFNLDLTERSSVLRSGADPRIYFGGGQTKVPKRKLRAKPESRARSARVSRAKPESRARSARELRAKPEPRAKPEKKRGEGSGEGAR